MTLNLHPTSYPTSYLTSYPSSCPPSYPRPLHHISHPASHVPTSPVPRPPPFFSDEDNVTLGVQSKHQPTLRARKHSLLILNAQHTMTHHCGCVCTLQIEAAIINYIHADTVRAMSSPLLAERSVSPSPSLLSVTSSQVSLVSPPNPPTTTTRAAPPRHLHLRAPKNDSPQSKIVEVKLPEVNTHSHILPTRTTRVR